MTVAESNKLACDIFYVLVALVLIFGYLAARHTTANMDHTKRERPSLDPLVSGVYLNDIGKKWARW